MLSFTILTEDDANSDRVSEKALIAMEAAIEMNQMWLKAHPGDVCFLTCGSVKYNFAKETVLSDIIPIKTVPILKKTGIGLCISFVAFDVAIRRMMGQDAWPEAQPTPARDIFHIVTVVGSPEGRTVIDPTHEIITLGGYRSAPSICKC